MMGPLRRRLTAISSVFTALVLAAALLLTFFSSYSQYRADRQLTMQRNVLAVTDGLYHGAVLSDRELANLEMAGGLIIYLADNGVPLRFSGAWDPPSGRAQLVELARQQAADRGLDGTTDQRVDGLSITGPQGDRYWASVVRVHSQGQDYEAVILHSRASEDLFWRSLVLRYVLIFLGSTLALILISWLLVHRAVRPTEESIQHQREFVAAAGHELRSPLAVIRASLSAADTAGSPAEKEKFIATADSEAARMGRLVDDLLLLAGSDAQVWHMCPQAVSLEGFCIELYDRYLPLCRQRSHKLELLLPEEHLPTIQADRERLTQLFGILLSNAMEYAPAGTPIELKAVLHYHQICLAVADHGPGIPDEAKPRVFERFTRADASRTDKAHFGLGLSVALELARLHGGTLTCTDTPGGGATFTLTLKR